MVFQSETRRQKVAHFVKFKGTCALLSMAHYKRFWRSRRARRVRTTASVRSNNANLTNNQTLGFGSSTVTTPGSDSHRYWQLNQRLVKTPCTVLCPVFAIERLIAIQSQLNSCFCICALLPNHVDSILFPINCSYLTLRTPHS